MAGRRSSAKRIAPGQPGDTSIARYRARRDFRKTPEPPPNTGPAGGQHLFVVQKHAARRLHYDFRLELEGVLKSWAVAKGPSLDPSERRLAARTEDHPIAYADFEGIIPAGQYGGGTVMLWDQGTWEPLHDPHDGIENGHLHFRLNGRRMRGEWTLVRMKGKDEKRENWLLIKGKDSEARPGEGAALVDVGLSSVATERTMEEIAADQDRVWHSDRGDMGAGDPVAASSGPKGTAADTRRRPARKVSETSGAGRAAGMGLPDFVPPQLATLVERPPSGGNWLHEIKYDGYRTACRVEHGRVAMLTRRGLDWTSRFAPVARGAGNLPVETVMLDGEIVVLGPTGVSSFARLQQSLSEGRADDLTYFVFDLLYLDGENLSRLPLVRRKERLQALLADLPKDGPIRYSQHYPGRGQDFFVQACRMALEGTVSKRGDAPYMSGRSKDWQKTKCLLRQEFVIGGFLKSTVAGRSVRSLLVGYYSGGKLVYAGKIGTGFSGEAAQNLSERLSRLTVKQRPFASVPAAAARGAVWVKPELVCEVAFSAWTADGMIRHAAFQGLREDKEPAAVTIEQPEPPGDQGMASDPVLHPERIAAPGILTHEVLDIGGGVKLTNPDKVLFPDQGVTKRQLADYYGRVALLMLPHVAHRPLSLVRCPEGRDKQCFFQRHYGPGLPAAIQRAPVTGTKDREDYVKIGSAAGLFGLVQIGVLEIHPWGSRADAPDRPDRIIFDFDPDEAVGWDRVTAAARECAERLQALGLKSFLKTTGGKGLHVVVPIARRYGWPEVKAFAKALAEQMAGDAPRAFTTTMAKSARKGRIFVDYLRNDMTSTAVGPYSTRARAGAPVAMPLAWGELAEIPSGSYFTLANVGKRLGPDFVDPWAEMARMDQRLSAKARKVLKLDV